MIKEINVINQGRSIATQWSRLTLSHSDNPIVASCHICNIHTSPQVNVCVAQRCFTELNSRYDLSKATQETLFKALVHIDVKKFDREKTIGAFFSNPQTRPKVIALQVSSDRVSEGHVIVNDNWIWLSMGTSRHAYLQAGWLDQFMDLDWDSAKRIANTALNKRGDLADLEELFGKLLDITHPGKPENRLAYRLLCEAYKFKKIDNQSNCEGIEIHAPEDIGQWLAPFEKTAGVDAAAKAKAIDEVAGMIGSGDIKTKAKSVLEAVNGNGGTLDEAIKGFLKELAKTNA